MTTAKQQDRGGEDLLAGALEHIRQRGGEDGDQAGAGDPRRDAAGDPAASAGDALGRREDDADDQAGLHGLAEDDDHADEHAAEPRSANANHSQLQAPLHGTVRPCKSLSAGFFARAPG